MGGLTPNLAAALAKAHGEFRTPRRTEHVTVQTRTGGSYSFDFAPLEEVMDCIRGPLAKHGITPLTPCSTEYTSMPDSQGKPRNVALVSSRLILLHASGERWESDDFSVYSDGIGPQQVASAAAYASRYALTKSLVIPSERDDDANIASGNQVADRKAAKHEDPPAPPPKQRNPADLPHNERLAICTHSIATASIGNVLARLRAVRDADWLSEGERAQLLNDGLSRASFLKVDVDISEFLPADQPAA